MTREPLVVGVDVGTGGCKTVAYNIGGEPVAAAYREYRVLHPRVGWAEQNPEDWWRAAAETLREVVSKVGPENIVAVGVTSQREAFAPLSREGELLANAIIWLDSRAVKQETWVKDRLGAARVLELTGLPVDQMFSAIKLLWFKEEMPSVFERISKVLFAKDYVTYKLTGAVCTDYSMASRTMLLDIRKLEWSQELCDEFGIPIDILPPLKGSWEVVGEVTGEASAATGLRKGTPVVAGGGDRPCEALGAGVIDEGEVNAGTGTGTCFEAPLSQPRPDPKGRVDACVHVVPGRWEYEMVVNATGESLRWFRDNLGYWEVEEARRRGVSPYDVMVEEASAVPPGSEGIVYFPYLWGVKAPFFNPRAKGAFIGVTHAHTRAHLIRAVLEGVAFHYRGALELLAELGVVVKRLSITGGEARSDVWNKIKAAVAGVPLHVPKVIDAASLGAAILAAVGARQHRDVRVAAESMVRFERVIDPDPYLAKTYKKLYGRYCTVYRELEKVFDLM